MYNKHINNVVLYAKNWYRHTEDLVSDLIKMCKLDDPSLDISTPEELQAVMWKNYNIWRDFSDDSHRHDDPSEMCVSWDDGITGNLHCILITYKCYIDDLFGNLQPPRYTDDTLPALSINNNVFAGCYSVDDYNAAAERYFAKSKEEVLEAAWEYALGQLCVEEYVNALRIAGEHINVDDIVSELNDIHKQTLGKSYDGQWPSKHMVFKSKHFIASVDYRDMNVSVECLLGKFHLTVKNPEYSTNAYQTMSNSTKDFISSLDLSNYTKAYRMLSHTKYWECLGQVAEDFVANSLYNFFDEELKTAIDMYSRLEAERFSHESGVWTGIVGLCTNHPKNIYCDYEIDFCLTYQFIWSSREKELYL